MALPLYATPLANSAGLGQRRYQPCRFLFSQRLMVDKMKIEPDMKMRRARGLLAEAIAAPAAAVPQPNFPCQRGDYIATMPRVKVKHHFASLRSTK